jgi:hypothetical protein
VNNETWWLAVPDWELSLPYEDPGPGDTVNLRGPFGQVKSFSRLDPRRTANPSDYPWEPNAANGVGNRVIGLRRGLGAVWVDVRRPTPVISEAAAWSAPAQYTAVSPENQVYSQ